jgi:uncharacterized protein (DUF58 family)
MKTFWRWLIVIVVLIGLALALKAGLVAFAGYVILGVLLLSRFLAKSWITNLEAEREVPEGQREIGDTVSVEVKLTNTGKVPVGWLLFEDMLPEYAFKARPARITVKGGRIKVLFIPTGKTKTIKYKMTFNARGYYQIGPAFAETGDVFGLHRRHRILTEPRFVLVLPKIVPLAKYQFASERPIGEIRLANRLFEDPTRTAGVRPYQMGDPLSRVHWRATARTGQLHCRVFEPTSLAGATILVDFFDKGYDKNREPYRSDLAVTTACSLAYAVSLLNQQVGFASNGRDAAERIKEEASEKLDQPDEGFTNRGEARENFVAVDQTDRLRPVIVPTRRGFDQFQQIRESLARLELTDGMTFPRLIVEVAPRLPKDATVIAVLPAVPVDSAIALGQLRRQGFAISAVLISIADDDKPVCAGRLMAEGIRDVRFIQSEEELINLGEKTQAGPSTYEFAVTLA